MKLETKVGYLKDEYMLLQRLYEDFDARVITIKGWSATVSLVALGGGFFQSPYLWLAACASGLAFWWLEALWKGFQYMNEPRIRLIENAFEDSNFDGIAPLQIFKAWEEEYNTTGLMVWRNMRLWIVCFPHIVPLVVGPALFLIHQYVVPLYPS